MEALGCQQISPAAGGTNPKAAAYLQEKGLLLGRGGLTREKPVPWLEWRQGGFYRGWELSRHARTWDAGVREGSAVVWSGGFGVWVVFSKSM